MPVDRAVELDPITPADVGAVAEFLHNNLNGRVSPNAWAAAVVPPWKAHSPNHGFMLRDRDRVVGAYLAFYSQREVDGQVESFCNLAAWCVLEEYRSHSVRLLRALLAQRGYHFTDLSPSGSVVPLNTRLKFRSLDTATALVPNAAAVFDRGRYDVVSDARLIEELLSGRDLEIYRDHVGAAAARHVVVMDGASTCYVMFRRDRRKGMPLFASILYVSDPDVFRRAAPAVFRHLLRRHHVVATLAELRVVGHRPAYSLMLDRPRPKMFKSPTLRPEHIDYLYSELTCVSW